MITIAYVPRYAYSGGMADGHIITAQMQHMARSAQGAFDAVCHQYRDASDEHTEMMTRHYPLANVISVELRRIKQRPRRSA